MTTEVEQLQILERIPGFTRPSAEWLAGLEVGDRFEFTHYANGKFDTKCLALVHSVCADYVYFTIAHLGDIRVSRSIGFEIGCSYWIWISPIEPEPPQQEAPVDPNGWADVADSLPRENHYVLAIDGGGRWSVARRLETVWVSQNDNIREITHWHELPEQPPLEVIQ
jgi:hypothetical protein